MLKLLKFTQIETELLNLLLIYKGESVCVCVCMSGDLPPDLHNQSPRNLVWAPHFTLARHRARGRPQMLTPGGTPYSDPV
jgi:hypothetical protein